MSHILNIKPEELQRLMESSSALLIDVREQEEYFQEKIPGSINIPLSTFDVSQIPLTDKKIVFQCRSGKRSYVAAQKLFLTSSIESFNLEGGIIAWKNLGLSVS